jgi:hypothetical protein
MCNLPFLLFRKVLLIWNFLSKFGDELISIISIAPNLVLFVPCSLNHSYHADSEKQSAVLHATHCYSTSRPHSWHVSKPDWLISDPACSLGYTYIILHVTCSAAFQMFVCLTLGLLSFWCALLACTRRLTKATAKYCVSILTYSLQLLQYLV